MNEYNAVITTVIIAAITFLMQKVLSNLFSGIALIVSRPFKKGDKVLIKYMNGNEIISGRIESISVMHVKIKTYNRDICIIPSNQFDNLVIINRDLSGGVNHTETIGITPDSNVDKAIALIRAAVLSDVQTENTDENTQITCKAVGSRLVLTYNVRTYNVDTSFEVCSDITRRIVRDLSEAPDITIA
ncbi:MAG: mechanosensitive ion channel family protein [Lachnospiraceae bacterium]|jgi:small-conductance mechanosensitive channel|nr:mechanosensitive ion channel family protein [Lachnospiraceae bacterium]